MPCRSRSNLQTREQISPTLGSEQLRYGLYAGLIGLLLVVLYSLGQYRVLGLVTVASIVAAGLLTYLAIAILGWSHNYRLDMAGVTGLIVAIGFTADSFIVYFERIRDELREGRSLESAVATGWDRAKRTILIADGVNFLAAIVLYVLASSSVRGFAFTLGLTTCSTSSSSSCSPPLVPLLARLPFFRDGHRWSGDPEKLGCREETSYAGRGRVHDGPPRIAGGEGRRRDHPQVLVLVLRTFEDPDDVIRSVHPIPRQAVDPGLQQAQTFYLVSLILMAIALTGLGINKLNLGLEFSGGSEFRVTGTSVPADYEATAREALGAADDAQGVRVSKLGAGTVRVQTERLDDAESARVRTGLAESFSVAEENVSDFIGPSWGTPSPSGRYAPCHLPLLVAPSWRSTSQRKRPWPRSSPGARPHHHRRHHSSASSSCPRRRYRLPHRARYSIYDTVVVFDKVRENTTRLFANVA